MSISDYIPKEENLVRGKTMNIRLKVLVKSDKEGEVVTAQIESLPLNLNGKLRLKAESAPIKVNGRTRPKPEAEYWIGPTNLRLPGDYFNYIMSENDIERGYASIPVKLTGDSWSEIYYVKFPYDSDLKREIPLNVRVPDTLFKESQGDLQELIDSGRERADSNEDIKDFVEVEGGERKPETFLDMDFVFIDDYDPD